MKRVLLVSAASLLITFVSPAQAHRDGCHRWHSCPSDRGTYECGDLGYTSGCPASAGRQPVAAPVVAAAPPVAGGSRHALTGVNLRAGPSTQSAIVMTLKAGIGVDVVNCAASWCQVRVGNRAGYVLQTYLR